MGYGDNAFDQLLDGDKDKRVQELSKRLEAAKEEDLRNFSQKVIEALGNKRISEISGQVGVGWTSPRDLAHVLSDDEFKKLESAFPAEPRSAKPDPAVEEILRMTKAMQPTGPSDLQIGK